jgi:hypothetical protein
MPVRLKVNNIYKLVNFMFIVLSKPNYLPEIEQGDIYSGVLKTNLHSGFFSSQSVRDDEKRASFRVKKNHAERRFTYLTS